MSEPGDTPIGFGGLNAYRTDVDHALAEADRVAADPKRTVRPASSASPDTAAIPLEPTHRDQGALFGGIKKIAGWAFGIGLIIAIKACVLGGVHSVTSPSDPSAETSSSATYAAPAAAADETTSAPAIDANSAASSSDPQNQNDSTASPGDSTGSPLDPTANAPSSIVKPAAADSAPLTISELRYCLAEEIRLTAEQNELDGLRSDPDHFNRNVETVNSAITDFKSRCSNRSFLVSDKQVAQPQIEAQRTTLEAEGRNRVS
jgi:hypothetical protein